MVDRRPEDLRSLRQLVAGGDVLSPTHVRNALSVLQEGVVINGYGPTESTTFACCYRMAKGYEINGSVPIGQPISNTSVYVLDERLQPLPPGVPGELFIGGAGLALGYLNQPELTRERFIPHPFSGEPSARLYRTGDRARLRSDRNIEFLGRVDNQVKISGHRIELEEIEATLRLHVQVRQAVVVAAEDSGGQKRLFAYLLPSDRGCLNAEELKRFLADRLPSFMIPSAFAEVDQFPLSPNGKVDRIALALTGRADPSKQRPSSRGTDREEAIARTWSKVLDRVVGLDDNFFDLGGDSLQLIEVHSELQENLGLELSMIDLFEFTTIRTLASRLSGIGAKGPALSLARERGRKQKEVLARQRQTRGSCP
jgi:non-ribosomal peptide synthetase component F